MKAPLFLFCGGNSFDLEGRPKPLIRLNDNLSLLLHFLDHLKCYRPTLPDSITLLCEDSHKDLYVSELSGFSYSVPINIQSCGLKSTTLDKLEHALINLKGNGVQRVQFGYPDIFFFGEYTEPIVEAKQSHSSVHISAAALTSRFPRLVVDIYNDQIKGISNYTSEVPANPMYVFGGDLWGRSDELLELVSDFRSNVKLESPSLEYDFFFWLINHQKMRSVVLHGERIWVDSVRDIQKLLAKTKEDL